MLINLNFPSPYNLKSLELKTINALRNNSTINGENTFQQFYNALNFSYLKFKDENYLLNHPISFESGFELEINKIFFHFSVGFLIQGSEHKTKRGALVNPNYEFVSYSLSICKIKGNEKIFLRRFHFDYALKNIGQPGPVFHFQFPGELSNYIIGLGIDRKTTSENFACWLSEPRINYFPMTFALLLDIIFNEFPNELTRKIKDDNYWLKILHENESQVIIPYFENCNNFLKPHNHKPSRLFLRNFCYGD